MKIETLRDSKKPIYLMILAIGIGISTVVSIIVMGKPTIFQLFCLFLAIGMIAMSIYLINKNKEAGKILARTKANTADAKQRLFGRKTNDVLMFLHDDSIRLVHVTEQKRY